jgi:predicted phosphodiesterase
MTTASHAIKDLKVLTGEVMLFGGVYSNLHALEALIARAEARGIAPSHMICTGDLVAYCAQPREVVERIADIGCTVVAGNCEVQIAADASECGCGFAEGSACDLASRGWYPFAKARLEGLALDFPDLVVFSHQGRRYAVIHGGLSDVARFIWSVSPEVEFAEEIALIEQVAGPIDTVIAGHSGIAFEREIAGKTWINAGVIGMPPNDGGAETEYAILGPDGVVFERLSYEAEGAAQAMRSAGLTQGYDDGLTTGLWPSQEVLPRELRR